MKRVPPINLFAPLDKFAGFFEAPPDDFDTVGVLDRLSIVRGVAVTIEIAFADNLRGQAKAARRLVHNFFDDQHALRPSEAAKRSLRSLMREADQAGDFHRGQQIGVVAMKHRSRQNWL